MQNKPLTCLVCPEQLLTRCVLEAGLKAHECGACHGRWVHGPDYLDWLGSRPAQAASRQDDATTVAEPLQETRQDSAAGKLCLHCGRFMRRVHVGHNVAFHLDRCASCGGFWFDAGEWEQLRASGLHREAHLVFTDAWQAQVRQQALAQTDRDRLTEQLGADGVERADDIAAWIAGHPRGHEILARILDATPPS